MSGAMKEEGPASDIFKRTHHMSQLPPFARALKTRHTGPENGRFTRNIADPDNPNRNYESETSIQSYRPEGQPKEQDYIDEIQDLRSVIQDLEQHVAELTAENRRLKAERTDADSSKQIGSDFQRQIDELKAQLRDEITKNQCLTEQVEQLEKLLESKRQLTEAKEQMMRRLQDEYQQVVSDYQRLLEVNSEQAGQLRQSRVDISELEARVAQMRSAARRTAPDYPYDRHRPHFDDFMDSTAPLYEPPAFQPHSSDTFPAPLPLEPEPEPLPVPEPAPYKPPTEPATEANPFVQSPKRSALVDNIKFGDESENTKPIEDDVESMTVPEMKQQLEILRHEKEELERKLNKAPPKGRLMAHVRREQEENEAQLDALTKRISRIRFQLRRLHAL